MPEINGIYDLDLPLEAPTDEALIPVTLALSQVHDLQGELRSALAALQMGDAVGAGQSLYVVARTLEHETHEAEVRHHWRTNRRARRAWYRRLQQVLADGVARLDARCHEHAGRSLAQVLVVVVIGIALFWAGAVGAWLLFAGLGAR